ncbi:MAG: hypothetical protein IPJ65_28100 [Archangiaceae bacterium]|nr:hypothetical protein [Archangiaceae bacterium]
MLPLFPALEINYEHARNVMRVDGSFARKLRKNATGIVLLVAAVEAVLEQFFAVMRVPLLLPAAAAPAVDTLAGSRTKV